MAKYIALMRGQIPADVTPVKRPEMTGKRPVMRMVQPGEVFEFDGKPGKWMKPYEDDAPAKPKGRPPKTSTKEGESGQTDQTDSPVSESQGKKRGADTH